MSVHGRINSEQLLGSRSVWGAIRSETAQGKGEVSVRHQSEDESAVSDNGTLLISPLALRAHFLNRREVRPVEKSFMLGQTSPSPRNDLYVCIYVCINSICIYTYINSQITVFIACSK